MFGKLWAQLRNEVKFNEYSKLCLVKQMFTQLRMGLTPRFKYSWCLHYGEDQPICLKNHKSVWYACSPVFLSGHETNQAFDDR